MLNELWFPYSKACNFGGDEGQGEGVEGGIKQLATPTVNHLIDMISIILCRKQIFYSQMYVLFGITITTP